MINEETLTIAALKASECILQSLPEPCCCNHIFSKRFEKRINMIIFRTNHPIIVHIFRAVACLIIILATAFGSILAIDAEAREIVFTWVKDQYKNFTHYFSEKNTSKIEDKAYELSQVPMDYSLISCDSIPGGEIYLFSNGAGELLQFSYTNNKDYSSLFINESNCSKVPAKVGNMTADLYVSNSPSISNGIVWTSENEQTLFFISGYISTAQLIDLAEKIIEK